MPRPVLRIILLLVAMLIPSTAGYAVASPGLSAPPSGAPPRVVTGPDPRPTAVSEHPLEDLVAAAPSARRQGAEDPPGPSATADTAGRSDRVGSLSTPFELVGARWPAGTTLDPSTVIEVRARVATGWSQWSRLSADDASPDPGDREGKAAGTSAEPVWFGDADAAEIRVSGAPAPRGLSVVAVHTTRAAADQVGRPGGAPAPGVGPRRSLATPDLLSQRPGWYSRAQWGADDALKPADCQAPRYTSTVKAVFVHHTAGVNGYAQADVPAILRGIYSYQLNNGWCDIAYNALVDRFGGIWEGRSGGLDQPVLSGATGGFNTNTWAISVLGNYQTASVSSATFWSLVTMISWELVLYGRDPVGTTTLTQSQGGTSVGAKWNDGDTVTLNVVNGHRDAVYTECPGNQLYALMDQLRASVNAQIGGSPIGNIEALTWDGSVLRISGWALDPGALPPVAIHVYVDGQGYAFTADAARSDVGAAYPLYGSNHGFALTIPRASMPSQVCVAAMNLAGGGPYTIFGCYAHGQRPPVGYLDYVGVAGANSVTIAGWALDRDITAPVTVHVTIDGAWHVLTADQSRADIGAAFPGYGPNHGFSATLPLPSGGTHTICAGAIDIPANPSGNAFLGCRTLTSAPPVGYVDYVGVAGANAVTVAGWALDRDTAAPVTIHVNIDGAWHVLNADQSRSDIGAAFPGYGPDHGFSATLPLPDGGSHTVCFGAIDLPTNPAGNAFLGCRTLTSSRPVGLVNAVTLTSPTAVTVSGWALDPDLAAAVTIHVNVDGAWHVLTADQPRADVGAAYPGYGPNHGFSASLSIPAATSHTVCVGAIDIPTNPAGNAFLGCFTR